MTPLALGWIRTDHVTLHHTDHRSITVAPALGNPAIKPGNPATAACGRRRRPRARSAGGAAEELHVRSVWPPGVPGVPGPPGVPGAAPARDQPDGHEGAERAEPAGHRRRS
eukprot:1186946-Prorocentrum_minimum.AAC.1